MPKEIGELGRQGAWRWSRIRLTGAAGLEGQLVPRNGPGSVCSGRAAEGPAGGRTPGTAEPAKGRACAGRSPALLIFIEANPATHPRRNLSSDG